MLLRRALAALLTALLAAPNAAAALIECNATAWLQEIQDANTAAVACPTGRVTTFNCTNTVIQIPDDTDRDAALTSTAPCHIIDGEDKGITFEMNPPWFTPPWPPSGGCGGEGLLWPLKQTGAGSGVRDLNWRYFGESWQLQGAGSFADGVYCLGPCDDCISNPNGANITISNSTFEGASDKCIQLSGNESPGSGSYDSTLTNNYFKNCQQPIRIDEDTGGRHLITGNEMETLDNPNSTYVCVGPRITCNSCVVYWEDNIVRNCDRGLRIGTTEDGTGGVDFISLGGNLFDSNANRGAACYHGAECLFENDTFTDNGGNQTGDPSAVQGAVGAGSICMGGTDQNPEDLYCNIDNDTRDAACPTATGEIPTTAGVAANCGCPNNGGTSRCLIPYLDLGGGSHSFDGGTVMSSDGGNTFTGNRHWSGTCAGGANVGQQCFHNNWCPGSSCSSGADLPWDVDNESTGTLMAECNTWRDGDPSDNVGGGPVDYSPLAPCGSVAGGSARGAILRGCTLR